MHLSQLPLEIQRTIFDFLILCHKPKDSMRAKLVSSFFSRHIEDALIRTDACFEVYASARPGRTSSNISRKIEAAYVETRLVAGRPLASFYQGEAVSSGYLCSLIDSVCELTLGYENVSRDQAISVVTSRLLDACTTVRLLLTKSKLPWGVGDSKYRYNLLCLASALGQIRLVLDLLSSNETFQEPDTTHGFLGRWQISKDHVLGIAPACAAHFGHLEVVKILMQPYYAIRVPESVWYCVLAAALSGGQNHIIEYMLGEEVIGSFHQPGTIYWTLQVGVQAGNMSGIKMLLENMFEDFASWTRDSDQRRDGVMSYILEQAAAKGNIELIDFALDKGAGSKHEDPDWFFAPASNAVNHGHLGALEVLLVRGRERESTLFETMLPSRKSRVQNPLHNAILSGNVAAVEMIMKYGAEVNTTFTSNRGNRWGATPLRTAIESDYDRADIVEFLLSHGASMTFAGATKWMKPTDYFKKSVWNEAHLMAIAANCNHANTIRVLAKYGASPHYPYGKPQRYQALSHHPMLNALRATRRDGRRDAVDALVELGAEDPGDTDADTFLTRLLEPKDKAVKRKSEEMSATRNVRWLRPR